MKKISVINYLVPAVLIACFFQATLTYAQKETTATTQTKNGLHVAKFSTPEGEIAVYFPGDGSAGDRICGSVISEPSGKNEKKIEKNKGKLEGYVFELEEDQSNQARVNADKFKWLIPLAAGEVMHLLLKDQNGNTIASADIPVNPGQQNVQFPEVLQPDDYALPEIIQAGMPSSVAGCFNSDISNTAVVVGNENAAILAESPHQCIFMAPENIVGPADIRLTEGEITSTGKTNSLDLNLTADKVTLTKGENTTIHLEITGLEGIEQTVPFEITNYSSETVSLSGGNEQTLEIDPAQVSAGGIYRQDFNVSAISAGSFSLVAEVTPPPPALIMLISPEKEIDVFSMIFTWNSINVPSDATYTFKIWQLKEYESEQELANYIVPYEEVKQSEPYYSQEGITEQSFDYYQVMDAPINLNMLYAWQVIAVFPDGTLIESKLGVLLCCSIRDDYKPVPDDGTGIPKYLPTGVFNTHKNHWKDGPNKSLWYPTPQDGWWHIVAGNGLTYIIPKGWIHNATKGTKDFSKSEPGGYRHIDTDTADNAKSKYEPKAHDGHLKDEPNKSKYLIKRGEHVVEGPDHSRWVDKVIPPLDKQEPGEAQTPVKPKTSKEISDQEKAKIDEDAAKAKKEQEQKAKEAIEKIKKDTKEAIENIDKEKKEAKEKIDKEAKEEDAKNKKKK